MCRLGQNARCTCRFAWLSSLLVVVLEVVYFLVGFSDGTLVVKALHIDLGEGIGDNLVAVEDYRLVECDGNLAVFTHIARVEPFVYPFLDEYLGEVCVLDTEQECTRFVLYAVHLAVHDYGGACVYLVVFQVVFFIFFPVLFCCYLAAYLLCQFLALQLAQRVFDDCEIGREFGIYDLKGSIVFLLAPVGNLGDSHLHACGTDDKLGTARPKAHIHDVGHGVFAEYFYATAALVADVHTLDTTLVEEELHARQHIRRQLLAALEDEFLSIDGDDLAILAGSEVLIVFAIYALGGVAVQHLFRVAGVETNLVELGLNVF